MTWLEYYNQFEEILNGTNPVVPYSDVHYLNYTKLNYSRTNRWLKTLTLQPSLVAMLKSVQELQKWIVITEHWCGDAAHIIPVLYKMSLESEKIELIIQLRDTDSEIEQYLTDGSKSIPKLIVRNLQGDDLFTWGPRPMPASILYNELKEQKADFETVKEELQKFYNADKALSIQKEIGEHLSKIV